MYAIGHEKLKQIHQKGVFNSNYESIPEVHETKVTCCMQSWNGKEINVHFIQVKVRVSPVQKQRSAEVSGKQKSEILHKVLKGPITS